MGNRRPTPLGLGDPGPRAGQAMQYGRGITRLDAYSPGLGHQAHLSRVGFVDVNDRCVFPWWRGSGEMRWRNAMKTSIDCQRGEALFCIALQINWTVAGSGYIAVKNCNTNATSERDFCAIMGKTGALQRDAEENINKFYTSPDLIQSLARYAKQPTFKLCLRLKAAFSRAKFSYFSRNRSPNRV